MLAVDHFHIRIAISGFPYFGPLIWETYDTVSTGFYRFLERFRLTKELAFSVAYPPNHPKMFDKTRNSGQPLGTPILMGFSSHPGTRDVNLSRLLKDSGRTIVWGHTTVWRFSPQKNNVSTPTKTTWNCVFRSCWGYYTIPYPNRLISMYIDSTEIFDLLVGFWVQATVYLGDPHVVCLRVRDWLERGSFPYWIVTPIRYSTTC